MRVLAVVFEDGSAEGEQSAIGFIHMRRLGEILEAQRVRDLLDSLDSRTDDASLAALENRIGLLSASPAQALASVEHVH
jgi:hypothetical protein